MASREPLGERCLGAELEPTVGWFGGEIDADGFGVAADADGSTGSDGADDGAASGGGAGWPKSLACARFAAPPAEARGSGRSGSL